MPEEYELMPHETIAKIKHELEVLKKRAYSKEKPSREAKESIDRLNENINKLMSLFQEAAKEMEAGEEEPGTEELMKRINEVEEENRKIAEGILVVADMIKELQEGEKKIEEKISRPVPMPRAPSAQAPPRPVFRQAGMERAPSAQVPPPPRPMPPPMQMPRAPPAQMPPPMPPPKRAEPELRPMGGPMPPPMPPGMPPRGAAPSPLPPLPEVRAGVPEKKGFLSKLFKKK
ncbi:hypothetical protein KY332_05115 [Candidatus Woesearchaeota archaeon]|nr:hypothetical protein [Candidatus Woesearchaeota archaeon]